MTWVGLPREVIEQVWVVLVGFLLVVVHHVVDLWSLAFGCKASTHQPMWGSYRRISTYIHHPSTILLQIKWTEIDSRNICKFEKECVYLQK